MIQDIEPHHLFNEFTPKVPADEDLVFVFSGPKLLADIQEDSCHFPHIRELQAADLNENLIWLFHAFSERIPGLPSQRRSVCRHDSFSSL